MSAKKHHVSLTQSDRDELVRLSMSQRHSERERKRARILLLCDEAKEGGADKDTDIAAQVKVAPRPDRPRGEGLDHGSPARAIVDAQVTRNTGTAGWD